MASRPVWIRPMTPEDKQFYQALGQRLAQARKELGYTQQQVADQLGVSQQTLAHYEVGRLRLAVSTLHNLAQMLHVSIDELLSNENKTTGKRGPASRLQQQMEEISQLPRSKQKLISEMLDGVISQKKSA